MKGWIGRRWVREREECFKKRVVYVVGVLKGEVGFKSKRGRVFIE